MRLAVAGLVATGALALAPSAGAISFVQEGGTTYATGAQPYGLVANDFDGDLRPDIATVNGTSSNLSVFLRQPGGGFSQEAGSPFAVGSGPNYAASADFNGDTRPDVAVANFVSNNVTILLRQAGGGFVQEAAIQLSDQATAIAAADFNGDTLPDLAVALWNTAGVAVVYRNPGGGFTGAETYPVGTNPRHLSVADFNSDTRPDLAVANSGNNTVQVLLRTDRSFTFEPAIVVGTSPANIAGVDLNGDGRPDLAVTNYGSDTVSVLLRDAANDGFTAEPGSPIQTGDGPLGLGVSDFDDDGAPDLAVSNNADDTVTVLRRTANGFTLDPVDPIPLGDSPYGLAVGDFDSDGRPDLAVGHDQPNELRVLLNTTAAPPPIDPDTDGDGILDSQDLCPTVPANTPDGCPPGPLPPPELGETANAAPVSGEVLVGIPSGSSRGARVAQKGVTFVPLTEARQIPIGSFLDTTEGTVSLRLARNRAGELQSGRFAAGLFQMLQSRRRAAKGLTELRMKGSASSFRRCRSTGAGARAALSRRAIRRLRARARGRYRTSGRHSAATVRGTKWNVVDRCDGTLTKVQRGKVAVRDFRLQKTIVLTRGKRYLAKAQG
ncbi:MAG: FG-GAP-like repeat-containing protein [Thermoleophilaceae bacterium]